MKYKSRIRRECRKCKNKFEPTGKTETLCKDCWSASFKTRGYKLGKLRLSSCLKCGEDILPNDDKVQVDSIRRVPEISSPRFDGAWKRNRLAVFHRGCFKVGCLLK